MKCQAAKTSNQYNLISMTKIIYIKQERKQQFLVKLIIVKKMQCNRQEENIRCKEDAHGSYFSVDN